MATCDEQLLLGAPLWVKHKDARFQANRWISPKSQTLQVGQYGIELPPKCSWRAQDAVPGACAERQLSGNYNSMCP